MAWVDESQEIFVGQRRVRVRRRRRNPVTGWIVTVVAVVAAAALTWWLLWAGGPFGHHQQQSGPPITAPGAFRAGVGSAGTITVGLQLRNTTTDPVTVTSAQVSAPAGLTQTALALLGPGQDFTLDGPLPTLAPVTLGGDDQTRDGFVVARFSVDCSVLAAGAASTAAESIAVTTSSGETISLTPPVVDGVAWLTATANHACSAPVSEGTPEEPLPPLPA